jgi:hypothetical protein
MNNTCELDGFEESDNLCDGCLFANQDSNMRPCNTCIDFVDGYLTAKNYENMYLNN